MGERVIEKHSLKNATLEGEEEANACLLEPAFIEANEIIIFANNKFGEC